MALSCRTVRILGPVILIAVCFWFILILFLTIHTPVTWGDEVLHGTIIKHLLSNQPSYPPFDISIFGRYFPVTTDMKHGAIEIYLLAPFMYMGGMTIEALRAGYIFWVVLIILLTYYFCYTFFSYAVANLAVFFLAVSYPYLYYSRIGTTFGLTLPFFVICSLIFIFKWARRRNNLYLYFAMFLLALGFQVKGWFICFILAVFLSCFVLNYFLVKVTLRTKIISGLVFCLGALPILQLYLKSNFFSFVVSSAVITTCGNVNNLNIYSGFITRLYNFANIVSGPSDMGFFCKLFPCLFFWAAYIFLIFRTLSKRVVVYSNKGTALILGVFFFTFLFSIFTLTEFREGHLIILFPLIQIILALSIVEVWRLSRSGVYKAGIILLTFLFLTLSVLNYFQGYRDLREVTKKDAGSGIPVLTRWLIKEKISEVRGFDFPVVCGIEFFGYPKVAAHAFKHYPEINSKIVQDAQRGEVFVFSLPYDTQNLENFKLFTLNFNKKLILLKCFNYFDGAERFKVYRLDEI